MSDVGVGVETRPRAPSRASRLAARRGWWLTAVAVWGFFLGNAAVIVWLWWHAGNVSGVHTEVDALTSVARITGLLGAYLALVQVVLLSRIPWLERLAGFDRLTVWHRYNGWICLDLVIAHVVFSVWGYARLDRYSLGKEISTMLGSGIYPGMITATVGTGLMIAVAASSAVIVKRRLRYEAWYAVHFTAYAAIALAWFHQIPTGNELVLDTAAARQRAALPPPSRVGGVRGGRRRLRADHRARARPSRRPAGTVLPLAVPRPGALVGRASLLSLRRARRAQPQDHGQGAR